MQERTQSQDRLRLHDIYRLQNMFVYGVAVPDILPFKVPLKELGKNRFEKTCLRIDATNIYLSRGFSTAYDKCVSM